MAALESLKSSGRRAVGVGMTGTLRALRRLLHRPAAVHRSSLRAGGEPYALVLVTPRVWVALG